MRYAAGGAILSLLLAGCGHPAAPPSPPPLARTPCPVTGVLSVDSSWRQVRGAGFTFCVPGSWRPASPGDSATDAKAWGGTVASVAWNEGRPPTLIDPHQVFTTSTTVVTVPQGQLPPTPVPAPLPAGTSDRPCAAPVSESFLVGTVAMVLTQVDCQGNWTVTAWSTAPAVYVQGVGHGPTADATLVSMVATIRFTAP